MTKTRPEVELLEKNRPRQERAKRTYENILQAAAELLVEVGVERISTNLIAERAGITVPALYRYFPNKYAVLFALGAKLMDRQNQIFADWYENHMHGGGVPALMEHIYELLHLTFEATKQQVGGHEITQALRAVQPLQELRLESHRLVAAQLAEVAAVATQRPADDVMLMHARLTVDTCYGVVEMALGDDTLSPENILRQGAHMISLYWADILARS
jgi:AcrR family transcriptional regulator